MKSIITLTIIAIFSIIAVTNAASVSWGFPKPYERLLHREIVTEKSKFMRIVTRDLIYPSRGINGNAVISRVVAIDQKEPSKGGKAELRVGGPGSYNVQIHLKSARNHGLSYIVEIYGN